MGPTYINSKSWVPTTAIPKISPMLPSQKQPTLPKVGSRYNSREDGLTL